MWLPCNKCALLESNECIKMSVFLKKHNVQTLLFILLFMRRNRLLPPLRLELKELKVNLGEGNLSLPVVVRMSGRLMFWQSGLSRSLIIVITLITGISFNPRILPVFWNIWIIRL